MSFGAWRQSFGLDRFLQIVAHDDGSRDDGDGDYKRGPNQDNQQAGCAAETHADGGGRRKRKRTAGGGQPPEPPPDSARVARLSTGHIQHPLLAL
jgi:hypothetical protein